MSVCDDADVSLATHLAALDAAALTRVLDHRRDVLVEPVPKDVAELADRLGGVHSLSAAMGMMDADELEVARALSLIGPATTMSAAVLLRADPDAVAAAVERLVGRALAWRDGELVGLPEKLAAHLAEDVTTFRPVAVISRQARSDDLKTAVGGLAGSASGTKPQLIARLTELAGDRDTILRAVAGLAAPARHRLEQILRSEPHFFLGDTRPAERLLVRAGLLVSGAYHRPELPREVAAILLLGDGGRIVGRPDVPPSGDPEADGRAGAEAAVLAITGLLDEAAAAPLAALKKGGIGARERKRLATRLGAAEPALLIDVAAALGLLTRAPGGYVPAAEYADWRDQPVAARWSALARAWLALEVSPTSRETDDGEVAPPVAMVSGGGLIRRALLRAASGGRSLRGVGAVIDWLCPFHGYDDVGRGRKLAAARHEAELLGVAVGDRLTALGERLVTDDDLGAADLLPETRGLLVLQSDLSAVVSGQVSAAAARVLTAAATPEGHGGAATWRFSPGSVRAALDAGWTGAELRTELAAVSDRALPQPLDYLIGDVERRHGAVRVRETRCCVTGAEAEIAEIAHTRGLAKLELRRLAPTVLTSPAAPDAVVAALRKAGFAPMPEGADGAVMIAERASVPAGSGQRRRERPRLRADDLAARLLAGPPAAPESPTRGRLAHLNPHLDAAEVALLADALDHGRDVHIRYRNSANNHSERDVAPWKLWDRWVTAYCYLRSADRDFAVRGIESVGPVG